MKRLAVVFTLGLLTACTLHQQGALDVAQPRPVRVAFGDTTVQPLCHVAPDGGPVVAERGIGGTGAPSFHPSTLIAERGIGGTGIGGTSIGNTGIVGIITGFASVCVDGLEVHYDASTKVDVEGKLTTVAALRAGQVVMIQARDGKAGLQAGMIAVRQEVAGRIDAVDDAAGHWSIAGQSVQVPSDAWGAGRFRPGDWVAISGLRRADGTILASRVDVAPPDRFSLHGRLIRDTGGTRVGLLALDSNRTAGLRDGQSVTVAGDYQSDEPHPRVLDVDHALADPASPFRPSVDHLVIQAFVRLADGVVTFNGLQVPASSALASTPGYDGMAVVSLDRRADGHYSVSSLHPTPEHPSPSAGMVRIDEPPLPPRRRSLKNAPSSKGTDAVLPSGEFSSPPPATADLPVLAPAQSAAAQAPSAPPSAGVPDPIQPPAVAAVPAALVPPALIPSAPTPAATAATAASAALDGPPATQGTATDHPAAPSPDAANLTTDQLMSSATPSRPSTPVAAARLAERPHVSRASQRVPLAVPALPPTISLATGSAPPGSALPASAAPTPVSVTSTPRHANPGNQPSASNHSSVPLHSGTP